MKSASHRAELHVMARETGVWLLTFNRTPNAEILGEK